MTIPDGVKWIGRFAFKDCLSLTPLIVPNSVDFSSSAFPPDCEVMFQTFVDQDILDGNSNHVSIGTFEREHNSRVAHSEELLVCKCFEARMARNQATPWTEFSHQRSAAEFDLSPSAYFFAKIRWWPIEGGPLRRFEIIKSFQERPHEDDVLDEEDPNGATITYAFFSEYLPWVDLSSALRRPSKKWSRLSASYAHRVIPRIVARLMVGVEILCHLGIYHNDIIHPVEREVHTVLVNMESGNLKIIDFGLSRFIDDDSVEVGFYETLDGHSVEEYIYNMLGVRYGDTPQSSKLVFATEKRLRRSRLWKHLKRKAVDFG